MKKIQKKRNQISKNIKFEKVKKSLIYHELDDANREIL